MLDEGIDLLQVAEAPEADGNPTTQELTAENVPNDTVEQHPSQTVSQTESQYEESKDSQSQQFASNDP